MQRSQQNYERHRLLLACPSHYLQWNLPETLGGTEVYADVKAHAERIYDRLADQTMPCDAPWLQDQIDKFRNWIDGGLQP